MDSERCRVLRAQRVGQDVFAGGANGLLDRGVRQRASRRSGLRPRELRPTASSNTPSASLRRKHIRARPGSAAASSPPATRESGQRRRRYSSGVPPPGTSAAFRGHCFFSPRTRSAVRGSELEVSLWTSNCSSGPLQRAKANVVIRQCQALAAQRAVHSGRCRDGCPVAQIIAVGLVDEFPRVRGKHRDGSGPGRDLGGGQWYMGRSQNALALGEPSLSSMDTSGEASGIVSFFVRGGGEAFDPQTLMANIGLPAACGKPIGPHEAL